MTVSCVGQPCFSRPPPAPASSRVRHAKPVLYGKDAPSPGQTMPLRGAPGQASVAAGGPALDPGAARAKRARMGGLVRQPQKHGPLSGTTAVRAPQLTCLYLASLRPAKPLLWAAGWTLRAQKSKAPPLMNLRTILPLDTGPVVATLDQSDKHHLVCTREIKRLPYSRLLLPVHCLGQISYLLRLRGGGAMVGRLTKCILERESSCGPQ